MEARRFIPPWSRTVAAVAAIVHLGLGCGTEGGKLAMTSSNAPPSPPPVLAHPPKTQGDWVTERWTMHRTETHLEGMRKGQVDPWPETRFTRRFTRGDEALGLCRVEVTREAPEAMPTEVTELSLRTAPHAGTAQSDEWAFARSVDAFPLSGDEAIAALAGRLFYLEAKAAWRVETSTEDGSLMLRYESPPPTITSPLQKTVQSHFRGKLVLTEGLPRALDGEITSIVSQAAFSGERQIWQVVDKVAVTWQFGSAP